MSTQDQNLPNNQQEDTVIEDRKETGSFINNNPDDKVTPSADDDDMLAGLAEAEAEIAAAQAGKGNDPTPTAGAETQPKAGTEGQNAGTKDEKGQNGASADDDDTGPMIPKARLDQVLQERDQFRTQAQYLQGVVDTQTKMIGTGSPSSKADASGTNAEPANGGNAAPATDDFNTKIEAAESRKLDLAKKYDDGELNTVDYQKQLVEVDREIRTLSNQQAEAKLAEIRNTATGASNAQLVEFQVTQAAKDIQAQHPFVGEIDKLPKAIAQGIWTQIDQEAQQQLIEQGINPRDGSAASRIALVQVKAQLADKYGPQFTGKTLEQLKGTQPGNQQPAPKTADGKQLSPIAKAREEKLALAQNQPPATADMGASGTANELTAAQIESMDDDALADLLARAPQAVQRAAGIV